MDETEIHNYRIVGDEYMGHERFVRVNRVIVAHSPEEAQYLAFQEEIIPAKVRDLGTTTEQAMAI